LSLDAGASVQAGQVQSGTIDCRQCGATYPIVRGLPRFVPAVNYADSFGFQWNIHSRTQLDSHTGLPISETRLWAALGGKANLRQARVLEAGSGAGRFTEVLAATGAEVVTFDYSSAVDANVQSNGGSGRVQFFQGDIFNIPLVEQSFDLVLCLGVLQHTPDPEAAFRSLVRYVRPGGRIAIDVYGLDIPALLQWKYLLRPLTKRMRKETLYALIQRATPPLVPLARMLRRLAGRAGARLVPIVEYSHLSLTRDVNLQWAVLDTFDMYAPAHDHPQSLRTVERWFREAGLVDSHVRRGFNGVVGSGRRPA
jgi:SAM-dependent methyltransferase